MGAKLFSRTRSPTAGEAVAIQRQLLAWYDGNKRALPWRKSTDPYRVWVAEVMLQQTRIAVVVPAYRRFLRAFPTMQRLAAASEDEVLAQWSGLGYYTRARSLHRAARELVAQRRRFPRAYRDARKLPGVGAYTAAAVLSIAYDQPHAAVDGNVVRVLSRLRRLALPLSSGEPHASIAGALLDRSRPGDWNQAIMELGETLCSPRDPSCGECPVSHYCQAYRADVVDAHPPRKARRRQEKVVLTMCVLHDREGGVLLERGAFPYLPDMWLPLLAGSGSHGEIAGTIRHAITYRSFEIAVSSQTLGRNRLEQIARSGPESSERRIFSGLELARVGRSSLLQKALSLVAPHQGRRVVRVSSRRVVGPQAFR